MPRVIGFHYTLHEADSPTETIDSSRGSDPLFFMEGSGQIIPGLERELIGMKPGDTRTIEVMAADAYGDVDPDLVARVERSQFPPHATLEIGEQFTVEAGENAPVFTIVDVEGTMVTVDANHPMAGKDLVFDVEIVTVRDATKEELAHGHAHGPHAHGH